MGYNSIHKDPSIAPAMDDDERRPNAIRIGISNPTLLLIPLSASSFGFVSGLLSTSQKVALQFLAENAHRQPSTLQGWYFYNKTKNYKVALESIKGGLKTAGRLGLWTSAFVGLQELGVRSSVLNSTQASGLAGTVMAVTASALYKLSKRTLPRRIALGLAVGALAGGLQDMKAWVAEKKREEEARVQHT